MMIFKKSFFMNKHLLASLCLCTALTYPEAAVFAAATAVLRAEADSMFTPDGSRQIARGVAQNLLGGPETEFAFWGDATVINPASAVDATLNRLQSGMPKEAMAKFQFLSTHFYSNRPLPEQDLKNYLTSIFGLCLVGGEGIETTLTPNQEFPNHFVDIARQLYESQSLPSDHIASLKNLGRLGHTGARALYARIISESQELNFYQKIHKLMFFGAVADPRDTAVWLPNILSHDPADTNLLKWDEAVPALTTVFVSALQDPTTSPEDIERLWEVILHPLTEVADFNSMRVTPTFDAIHRAIQNPLGNAWDVLTAKLRERFGLDLNDVTSDLLTKINALTTEVESQREGANSDKLLEIQDRLIAFAGAKEKALKEARLRALAERFSSIRTHQFVASNTAIDVDIPAQDRRNMLTAEMEAARASGDINKAKGIGNVLALAMSLGQDRTLMAVMNKHRQTLKAAYDALPEGKEKLGAQMGLWAMDQILVMQGKSFTQDEYQQRVALLKRDLEAQGPALTEAVNDVVTTVATLHTAANAGSPSNDLGFANMTPVERFEALNSVLHAPLGIEYYINAHYGAVAFDNERFDDLFAGWGMHFGLSDLALQDIHTKTGNTAPYNFMPPEVALSTLLELAISSNLRPAQELVLKHVRALRDQFLAEKETTLAQDYDAYLQLLAQAFGVMRYSVA